MTKKRGIKTGYGGNCRMIEIGSGGVPFRMLVNVDHIDSLRFEEVREAREVPIPGKFAVSDADRNMTKPETESQVVHTGWTVIVVMGGRENGINFNQLEPAMNCYNSIIGMIKAVGVPTIAMPMLQPPPAPEEATDVHPYLAGGDGDGVAENDDGDGDLELSDEDLELLEHPEIDVDGLEEVFAKPEDPPAKN